MIWALREFLDPSSETVVTFIFKDKVFRLAFISHLWDCYIHRLINYTQMLITFYLFWVHIVQKASVWCSSFSQAYIDVSRQIDPPHTHTQSSPPTLSPLCLPSFPPCVCLTICLHLVFLPTTCFLFLSVYRRVHTHKCKSSVSLIITWPWRYTNEQSWIWSTHCVMPLSARRDVFLSPHTQHAVCEHIPSPALSVVHRFDCMSNRSAYLDPSELAEQVTATHLFWVP